MTVFSAEPSRTPISARRRILFWTSLALAAAVIVAGGVLAYTGYQRTTGPTGVVRAFFDALERADAPAALGYSRPAQGDARFLTSAVLAGRQRATPMSAVKITGVSGAGVSTAVSVSYRVQLATGSVSVVDQVPVRPTAHGWRLSSPAVTLVADSGNDRRYALLGGFALPSGPVLVFPGAIALTYLTPYLQLDPTTALARFSDAGGESAQSELSTAGSHAVSAAILAMVSACMGPGPAPLCPVASEVMVPGSLKSATLPQVVDSVSLTFESGGRAYLTGTVHLADARYTELDTNNQPVAHHGALSLPVTVTGSLQTPLQLHWAVTT